MRHAADWSVGNAMTILFGHVTGAGVRWVEAYDILDGTVTPALVVEVKIALDALNF